MATPTPVKYAVRTPTQRFIIAVQHVGQQEDSFQRSALSDPEGENSPALEGQRAHLARLQADLATLEKSAKDEGADTDSLKVSHGGGPVVIANPASGAGAAAV